MFSSILQLTKSRLYRNLYSESFSFFFASICIFLIPFYTYFAPPFLILWLISRIFEIRAARKQHEHLQPSSNHIRRVAILFAIFFFLQLISLLYSANLSKGLNIIFSRLSFLILPILFIYPGKKISENSRYLLKIFTIGTILFILYSLIYAVYRSVSFDDGVLNIDTHPDNMYWLSYFFGSDFSVNQHPSYTAIFVVFSLIIAIESIFITKGISRLIWTSCTLLLIFSIYLLSSRSGFLISIITLPVYFAVKLLKNKRYFIPSVFLILLMVGGAGMIKTNQRMKFYMEQISGGTFLYENSGDSRILIWKSGLNIIRENLLFGVGVGDVRDELMKQYLSIGDEDLIKSHYNAHNQFIEIAIEGGLLNLLIFFILLGYLGFVAAKQRNLLLTLFILIIFISFLFETILYRLAGIMFFTSFTFLLLQDVSRVKNQNKIL